MKPERVSERVIIPMSPEMLAWVDEYRFTHRLPSRADAIRKLIEASLSQSGVRKPESGRQ